MHMFLKWYAVNTDTVSTETRTVLQTRGVALSNILVGSGGKGGKP